MLNLFMILLFLFDFGQCDISGEVVKILKEDGGQHLFYLKSLFFSIFLFALADSCHIHCYVLQIPLDTVMDLLQSFLPFLE